MSNDNAPDEPDRLIDLGPCGDDAATHHMLAVKDGVPTHVGHMQRAEEGRPLPADCDLYHVEPHSGRVVSRTRIGNGPAQVATPAYRDNYDRIFGTKNEQAN